MRGLVGEVPLLGYDRVQQALAKVTGGRDCMTFSLAPTCHFVSIFPRVFEHAFCVCLVPFVFPAVPQQYRETCGSNMVHSHTFKCSVQLYLCYHEFFPFCPHCGGLCDVQFCARSQRPALDPCGSRLKIARKHIAHFHGGGALRLNARNFSLCGDTSVEQTSQRLGVAEGVIREPQDQLQRVSAGHQAAHEALPSIHQEMNPLRGQIETRSRIRLVELKSLMPHRFGKKTSPSWRTWSYLARDFVGVMHTVLKQAMKNAENQKQQISVTRLQQDFGVTTEMDQELQHFLISRTEVEALEVVRGAEREPFLEQWPRLAALYDPPAAGRSLDDSRQILSPPKVAKFRRPLARSSSL